VKFSFVLVQLIGVDHIVEFIERTATVASEGKLATLSMRYRRGDQLLTSTQTGRWPNPSLTGTK
jgi:hypothetical protein